MNSKGHTRAARLVNTAAGGVFDQALLELGAVDPDKTESGFSYAGKEAKHHHADGPEGLGQAHDERDITEVVTARFVEARRYWIEGKLQAASFEFGVATHYLLDGLICSPSIDAGRHAEGDRLFTLAFLGHVPVEIAPMDHRGYGRAFVESQLKTLQAYWGKNDLGSVDTSYAALVQIARAVTAPAVVAEVQLAADKALELQAQKTVAAISELTGALPQAIEQYREGLSDSLKALRNPSAIKIGLFAASRYYTPAAKFSLFRWLVSLVEPMVTRGIWRTWKRQVLSLFSKAEANIQTATAEADRAIYQSGAGLDAAWYTVSGEPGFNQAAAAVAMVQQTKLAAKKTDAGVQYKTIEAAYTKSYAKRFWPGSTPDRIARFFEENPGYKMVVLGGLLLVLTCMSVAWVVTKSWVAFWLVAVVAVVGFFAMKAISCWQEVAVLFWKRVPFTCPKCKAEQEQWVHIEETEATCSACGQGVYFGTAHHSLD